MRKVMKIVTDFWLKPIPMRNFDWAAVSNNYEPGDPVGYGATKKEAIKDYLEKIGDSK